MSRTNFGLTTPLVEIAAVRSKNEFLAVPISLLHLLCQGITGKRMCEGCSIS
jgi:hypothetical protein